MPVHSTVRKVRSRPELLLESLLDPKIILSGSKYVEHLEKIEPKVWTVTFKWKKFGFSREFDVDFTVLRDGNTVVYESVEGSPHRARLVFTVVRDPEGWSELHVTAEFDLGGIAGFFAKGDFARFIEELVDNGVRAHFERLAKRRKAPKVDCRSCQFYEATRGYCYALNEFVKDPEKPPCNGSMYSPAEGPAEGKEEGGEEEKVGEAEKGEASE